MAETKGLRKSWTDPNFSSVTFTNGFHVIHSISYQPGVAICLEVRLYQDESDYDANVNNSYAPGRAAYEVFAADADFSTYFSHGAQNPVDKTLKECAYDYLKSLAGYSGAVTVTV